MKLELCDFPVRDVRFGPQTLFADGVLTINKEEMACRSNQDAFFSDVRIDIARPNESTRIINVMDVMQPRFKDAPEGGPYPGTFSPMRLAGEGRTHVMQGVSVMQVGKRQGIQEGIIDMAGIGAGYSLFSSLFNIVLQCSTSGETSTVEYDKASRKALAAAALYLGETTRGMRPERVRTFCTDTSMARPLKKIVYIYYLQSQGPLRNTFVYGEEVTALLPTILHPNEVLDGAIVSGNYIIACQKNPTYLHLNNPVVLDLYARHGQTLDFAGVVIANEHNTLFEKKRTAEFAAKLARQLGAEGVIMTQEGGGHADSDLMLCTDACAKLGLESVMLINELAGPQGDQPSLVDTTPLAKHVVSTGNNDEVISLPAVEHLFGGTSLLNVPDASQPFKTALGRMYTATNQFGVYRITVAEF